MNEKKHEHNGVQKLEQILLVAQEDFVKFYKNDNKAAGTRLRKAMQDIKNLAQEIRKEVQNMKNAKG